MTGPLPEIDRWALGGRIVQMDAQRSVIDEGVVYVTREAITAVLPATAPPPAGFESVSMTRTRGTIFPGLIELHNHLPYDVLGLWAVPKLYTNRDQWSGPSTPDYHRLITGPMQMLGADPQLVAAVVRYVEVRCLLGGTTTSQGVTLASASGIIKHFRGLVRNVESTGDPALPPAATHIADVDAKDAAKFLARISGTQKLILHLSEGTDNAAHNHFAALQISPKQWAITANLIGIHCAALTDADFAVMAAHGGSMVWPPLSNLLLYGATANVKAAVANGVPIALGSDWAPSGSKNLLGELKTARIAADMADAGLSDADLVAMATSTPAAMIDWAKQVGSLDAGKKADLLVVAGSSKDPYRQLIDATEADLRLVAIGGTPRVGTPTLMKALGAGSASEDITVAGRKLVLDLNETLADPDVARLSVAESLQLLTAALHDLPKAQKSPRKLAPDQLLLAVEGLVENQMSPRPHLPLHGKATGPNLPGARLAAAPGPMPALTLDPLTAVDNPRYYATLALEPNVPDKVKQGLHE